MMKNAPFGKISGRNGQQVSVLSHKAEKIIEYHLLERKGGKNGGSYQIISRRFQETSVLSYCGSRPKAPRDGRFIGKTPALTIRCCRRIMNRDW